ncbi:MAG: ribosome small subunit-dependent GTPase A [Planctomycetota bacterium]|jgi:ribosome biogenesis GTPase|nr:ribosome small subunit-dependent GTPase A [Planctomycetota bacterium]MDP6762049.1 ribosome small subunit-dependent GTPase A [Planctomycetota bacterium]MDP6989148.1 ribosome small subunit-dependent GTPase A [Planctomycetota bacterium]
MSRFVKGRVVRLDAKVCHVDTGDGVHLAAPRGALFEQLDAQMKNPVAVGDWVYLDMEGDPVSLVEVLERENYLGRTASSHDPREQVLVANVDQLLVIASVAKPKFSSVRTDRILAACEWHQIPTALVLNKTDLARGEDVEAIRSTYEQIPLDVLEACATRGEGIEQIRERLRGKVTVMYGASGVGKSTLLNALQPGLDLKVRKVSKYWDAGKHTTTFSHMIDLEFGAQVIDTPGIRVFRLHRVHHSELKGLFAEFARFEADCRFPNCVHDHEPDCAVLAALEAGALPPSRYASYLELLLEAIPDDPLGDEPVEAGPS